jgi:hypothetical protein
LFPPIVYSSTIIKISFDKIVTQSDIIFSGKVINIESHVVENDRAKIPYTFVTVSVQDKIKGDIRGDVYTIKLLGGKIQGTGYELRVGDMPTFKQGQEVFLFLKKGENSHSPVVGFSQGKFTIKTDSKTGKKQIYDNEDNLVTDDFVRNSNKSSSSSNLDYETFKNHVINFIR